MTAYNDNEHEGTVPFTSAEEVWFWFIDAQIAKEEGIKMMAGASLYPRPCEPVDILNILDRLYRNRKLLRDHLLILRHYGRRKMAPDPYRVKEQRAYLIWQEALDILGEVFASKGIMEDPRDVPSREWYEHAQVWEGAYDGR